MPFTVHTWITELVQLFKSGSYEIDEDYLKEMIQNLPCSADDKTAAWKWLHSEIHITGEAYMISHPLRLSPKAHILQELEEPCLAILARVRSGQMNLSRSSSVNIPCIHRCQSVLMEQAVHFQTELTAKRSGPKPRTITEFCVTNEYGLHTPPVTGSFVVGLCGAMDLTTLPGQFLAAGRWYGASETFWVKLRVIKVERICPKWFRDGKTPAVVISTSVTQYVLQQPCAHYRVVWFQDVKPGEYAFVNPQVQIGAAPPGWALKDSWWCIEQGDAQRRALAGHKRKASGDSPPPSKRASAKHAQPETGSLRNDSLWEVSSVLTRATSYSSEGELGDTDWGITSRETTPHVPGAIFTPRYFEFPVTP